MSVPSLSGGCAWVCTLTSRTSAVCLVPVCRGYWRTFYQAEGSQPPKGAQGYPVSLAYGQFTLLTDNHQRQMSTFIPQFCWFLAKDWSASPYYRQLTLDWLRADQQYCPQPQPLAPIPAGSCSHLIPAPLTQGATR